MTVSSFVPLLQLSAIMSQYVSAHRLLFGYIVTTGGGKQQAKPPNMENSCAYIEYEVTEQQQQVIIQHGYRMHKKVAC
jgi:hypothetical protein